MVSVRDPLLHSILAASSPSSLSASLSFLNTLVAIIIILETNHRNHHPFCTLLKNFPLCHFGQSVKGWYLKRLETFHSYIFFKMLNKMKCMKVVFHQNNVKIRSQFRWKLQWTVRGGQQLWSGRDSATWSAALQSPHPPPSHPPFTPLPTPQLNYHLHSPHPDNVQTLHNLIIELLEGNKTSAWLCAHTLSEHVEPDLNESCNTTIWNIDFHLRVAFCLFLAPQISSFLLPPHQRSWLHQTLINHLPDLDPRFPSKMEKY